MFLQPLTLTQNIQSGRAGPCPIVPRARESIHRRARLFHRQVPGLSTINDRPDAFYTMSDTIIGPLSDGNANGSDSSRQTSPEHGDGAEPTRNEENVVTDGPQIGQPGAAETDGVRPSNHSAPENGLSGSGSGIAAPMSKSPPRSRKLEYGRSPSRWTTTTQSEYSTRAPIERKTHRRGEM